MEKGSQSSCPFLVKGKEANRYEKPVLIKKQSLTFPVEILEKFNGKRFCIQCSSCHGCR